MITPNKLVSITYPRHGLHFLKENLTQKIGDIDIYFQHDFIHHTGETVGNDDLILTVIRKPSEAIASNIVAGLVINELNIVESDPDRVKNKVNLKIKEYIDSYVETYYNLNTYKNLMVVDFKGFERNPLYVFDYILKNLNVDHKINTIVMPKSNETFLASSKGNKFYEYCHGAAANHPDISKALKAYSMLAKRLYENIDPN